MWSQGMSYVKAAKPSASQTSLQGYRGPGEIEEASREERGHHGECRWAESRHRLHYTDGKVHKKHCDWQGVRTSAGSVLGSTRQTTSIAANLQLSHCAHWCLVWRMFFVSLLELNKSEIQSSVGRGKQIWVNGEKESPGINRKCGGECRR